MTDGQEPIHDIAHLAHFEIFTPKPDESLWFFKEILGMEETDRQGQSVYMRAWGDYDHTTLKIIAARAAWDHCLDPRPAP
jgi:catechol 2,3-dioxygenase